MSGSVNKVILVGRLGGDPTSRSFQNGGKVVSLNIATSETWRDKQSGDRKERTEWHKVSILNENLAKLAEQYLKKGSKVYIEGQLENRKWTDKDGIERYATEVVLRPFNGEITLLDVKPGDHSRGQSENTYDRDNGARTRGNTGGYADNQGSGYDVGPRADMDDEIPF